MLKHTVERIKSSTLRILFDVMANHLMTQRRASFDEIFRMCMYRSPDGLKCAVGVLIDDQEYTIDLEGNEVDRILGNDVSQSKLRILQHFQRIHDVHEPSEWEAEIRHLASAYNFKWEPKQ